MNSRRASPRRTNGALPCLRSRPTLLGRRCSRGGNAGLALLLIALLLIGLGAASWVFLLRTAGSPPGPSGSVAASPGAPSDGGAVSGARAEGALQTDPGPRTPATQAGDTPERESTGNRADVRLQEDPLPRSEDPARFRGEGVLRGELTLPAEAELTGPWTLVVGPSPWLVGAEHATSRRVEFPAEERSFRVEELPLAGYQLTVEAAGWTSQPANVLLQRGAEDVFATLQLDRNATVEGTLFRDNGVAAEGIAAWLEPLNGGAALESVVGLAGAYRFEGVPEGNWRLLLGPPTSPLLPARLLEVRRPGITLPPATLPPLSYFRLVVVNTAGDPIPGVEVSGSGIEGGVVRGETDEYGVFVGRNAPPGRWTVRLSHSEHGSRRQQFVVRLEEPYEDTLVLPR